VVWAGKLKIFKLIETIHNRVNRRIAEVSFWRRLGLILSLAWWAGITSPALARTPPAVTNVPPTQFRPLLTTNSAASPFLQNHPELAQPISNEQPGLSLNPDDAKKTAPPQVTPSGSELFPDTFHGASPMLQAEDLAGHLLVVYNSKDPDSQGLAQYYASQRNIPAERVLAISCPVGEEITRAQFDDEIRSPIVSYLCQKDWMVRQPQHVQVRNRVLDLLVATRNDIWAIVLIRGVPLKIAPDPSDEDSMEDEPELQTNEAAVDSELALLPVFGLPKGGFVPNIFFDDQVSGIKRVGPELARNMVLVTRLDGPKVSDVRRMIDDTIYAEKNRLAGLAVVDSRGFTDVKDGYTCGDIWLRSARDSLVQDGWIMRFDDKPAVLPGTDPCNQVALYLGWYHDMAIGPWITPPDRFVRGAIAYHLHSFSASTVRSETACWVGPLIAHGAAATMGMVFEPYLALTPHEDIFTRRLLQGDYFAEAAYASERGLSWMLTVVGDPLYRPFREPLDSALARAKNPHTPHDDWLLLQKVQREIVAGEVQPNAENLKLSIDIPGAGPVAEENLGDLLGKLNERAAGPFAEQAYRKALTADRLPVDRIRVGLKLAQYYIDHSQGFRVQNELDSLRQLYPQDAQRYGVANPLVPTSLTPPSPVAGTKPAPLLSPQNGPGGNKPSLKKPAYNPLAPPRPPSLPQPTPIQQ
jgi:uncharacterized protein (TIGR03790 family)